MGQTIREKSSFNGEDAMKKKIILIVSILLVPLLTEAFFCHHRRPNGIALVGIGMINMGLGKATEYFSYTIKRVARCQGTTTGHRAIKRPGDEYELSMLSSGIIRKDTTCYLTAGMEIDLEIFFDEIKHLQERGISTTNRVWVSPKAQIVFPFHKALDDCMAQLTQSSIDIGSRKGTGSAAACKRLRIGIRVADLLDEKRFKAALQETLTFVNNMLVKLFDEKPYDFDTLYTRYRDYAKKLKPYIMDDLEIHLNKKLLSGEAILFEGAQGSSADVSFGAYPYVSSSSTSVAGICTGAGIGPNKIGHVMGVVPAYVTVLGEAPLPTEIKDLGDMPAVVLEKLNTYPTEKREAHLKNYKELVNQALKGIDEKVINSFKKFFKEIAGLHDSHPLLTDKVLHQHLQDTIVTYKIDTAHEITNQNCPDRARYGWIDLVMIREAILLNGIDSLVLTKLDVLDDFDEIKICIDYKVGNKSYDYMPSMIEDNKNIEPAYITLKGWKQPTSHIRKFSQLPEQARDFIKRIEMLASTPISHISVGPEREQMIVCEPLGL